MATTITSMEPVDKVTLELDSRATSQSTISPSAKVSPFPLPGGVQARYRQKCRDTVSLQWTSWETFYQDIYGNEYPGAGFNFSTYRIVGIVYARLQ